MLCAVRYGYTYDGIPRFRVYRRRVALFLRVIASRQCEFEKVPLCRGSIADSARSDDWSTSAHKNTYAPTHTHTHTHIYM